MASQFDPTDASAVARRATLNTKGALYDLEEWIIHHVHPSPGQRVLDLGCGTGKQIFAVAGLVLPGGSVQGLDISAEAVAEVQRRAREEGIEHVSASQGALDDCLKSLRGQTFDLILSAYAIYYAKAMTELLCGLRALLVDEGQVFACGPGLGTNAEMNEIISALAGTALPEAATVNDFISQSEIAEVSAHYRQATVVRLENRIFFRSVDDVMAWWEKHVSYVPALAEQVRENVGGILEEKESFELTKNCLGLLLHI